MPPKDFKIEAIFSVMVQSVSPVLNDPEIQRVMNVFVSNMHNVFCLGAVVPMFVAHSTFFANAQCEARHKLKVDPDSPTTTEIMQESYRIICEFVKNPQYQNRMHQTGLNNTKHLMDCYEGVFDGGMEAVLWAMITGSWTAFEVICEDLFKCATNARPAYFSGLKVGKPGFRSRKRIREAYEGWFQCDAGIQNSLSYPYVDALALFRNVKVHKGGFADMEFITEISKIPIVVTPARGLNDGDKIEMDGAIARPLIAASIKSAESLAKSVDDWILSPP